MWFAGRSMKSRAPRVWTASASSRNWSSGVAAVSNSARPGFTARKSVEANGEPKRPMRANVVGTGCTGSSCTMRKRSSRRIVSRRATRSRSVPSRGIADQPAASSAAAPSGSGAERSSAQFAPNWRGKAQ